MDDSISEMIPPAKAQLLSSLPVDFNFALYLSDVYSQAVVRLVGLSWPAWACVQCKCVWLCGCVAVWLRGCVSAWLRLRVAVWLWLRVAVGLCVRLCVRLCQATACLSPRAPYSRRSARHTPAGMAV